MGWKPGQLFTITTENYRLSPLMPDDVTDDMIAWLHDTEVMEFFILPKMNRESFCKFLKNYNNPSQYWLVITDRETDKAIGFLPLYCNYMRAQIKSGICIGDKNYWGTGCVQEIRSNLINFIFTEMRMHKVCGDVDIRNIPSIFNYKSQGFKSEGILRKEIKGHDGKWHDHYRFSLLREEWLDLQKEKNT